MPRRKPNTAWERMNTAAMSAASDAVSTPPMPSTTTKPMPSVDRARNALARMNLPYAGLSLSSPGISVTVDQKLGRGSTCGYASSFNPETKRIDRNDRAKQSQKQSWMPPGKGFVLIRCSATRAALKPSRPPSSCTQP